jgi:hypothetical protein
LRITYRIEAVARNFNHGHLDIDSDYNLK